MRRILMFVLMLPYVLQAATWYVDGTTGSDSNAGESTASAKKTIQAAIDVATKGDEICVRPGIYAPITAHDKALVIVAEQGPSCTIIDGGGSSSCAILGDGYDDLAQWSILRGFTIQNGFTSDTGAAARWAYLDGCVITKCQGKAIVYACKSYNCLAYGNTISLGYGYGVFMHGDAYNCTVVDGGGRYAAWDNGFYNCIVLAGIYLSDGQPECCHNCLLSTSRSKEEGNIVGDPKFVDADNGDYRLAVNSPCIDAGNNEYVKTDADTIGNARIVNGRVDIGAYEYGSAPVYQRTYAITFNANGGMPEPSAITRKTGEPFGDLPIVMRSGYVFGGWYTAVSGGEKVSAWSRAMVNVILYAHWVKPAGNIVISDVEVFSGYPWKEVVIGYKITGSTDKPRALEVAAMDNVTGKAYVCKTLEGVDMTPGNHVVKWNASADGAKFKSDDVAFTVRIVPLPLYYVIDLSGGSTAASYPVTELAEMPSGGWTDKYKTTKLVLRRIDAGSFKMQNQYDVTLTKPFYIGIFEVTQKQYELVMGTNPSHYQGDMRPVEWVSYETIRGDLAGASWPVNNTVDATSFLGVLRAKTGLDFDLPTEAQWEYACRAGTASDYNNGGSSADDLKRIGRYSKDKSDGKGGYTDAHTTVGSYPPNAWGLYDMHGNVEEFCLDWCADIGAATDPVGADSGLRRVLRGGSWYNDASYSTSSHRRDTTPTNHGAYFGFRLSRVLENQ